MPGLFLRYLRLNEKREREAQLERESWSVEAETSPRGESIDDVLVLAENKVLAERWKSQKKQLPVAQARNSKRMF